uniref:Vesicle transport protein SEC20-like n=2 Tax=Hirondellea gigas TaxID=1518452 RepID=A0A6A7G3L4_9CRUS
MFSSSSNDTDKLYANVVKQDIVKCDVALKGYLLEIREHCFDEAELNELAAQVRSKITQLKGLLTTLRSIAQEQDGVECREAALQDVCEHDSQLQQTHSAIRTALLRAKLAIAEREKSELFSSPSSNGIDTNSQDSGTVRHRMSREHSLKQSSQVNDDLLTAARMIQETTDKSAKTLDSIVESSQTIGSTKEELNTMGSVISQARKLLSKYGRRENTDKLLIFIGLVFFIACCLVVIRNRL